MADFAQYEDRPRQTLEFAIGAKLDGLSVGDFDERIAMLQVEIERLEAAKRDKQAALDRAASLFRAASKTGHV